MDGGAVAAVLFAVLGAVLRLDCGVMLPVFVVGICYTIIPVNVPMLSLRSLHFVCSLFFCHAAKNEPGAVCELCDELEGEIYLQVNVL